MSATPPDPTPRSLSASIPPPPSLTQAYLAAAVSAITSLALTQSLITNKTAQLIAGLASIVIPLVLVGVHALSKTAIHRTATLAAQTTLVAAPPGAPGAKGDIGLRGPAGPQGEQGPPGEAISGEKLAALIEVLTGTNKPAHAGVAVGLSGVINPSQPPGGVEA